MGRGVSGFKRLHALHLYRTLIMRKKSWIIIICLAVLAGIAIIAGKIKKHREPTETAPPETETMVVYPETEEGSDKSFESEETTAESTAEPTLSHEDILTADELMDDEEYIIIETKPVSPDLTLTFDASALSDYKAALPFDLSEEKLNSVTAWYVSQLGYTDEVRIRVSPVYDYDDSVRSFHYLVNINNEHESILSYNITYQAWAYREVTDASGSP